MGNLWSIITKKRKRETPSTPAPIVDNTTSFVLGNSIKKRKRETPSTPAPIVDNTTASASTSAADLVGEYEVFLSFRGADTRNGFTDYLYHDLIGARVRTFRDDNELPFGEKISAELPRAIEQSKISIPIFSKNYASSKWCLRELAHMVECWENGGQLIYPIFYDVKPNEVQHCERGSYKDAFLKYKNDKELDEKIVQQWKEALEKVGGLKGLELKKETNGREGEFVKKVVEEVLSKLRKNHQDVPKNLVGMDSHIKEMEGRFNSDSNGLRIIGILGMGGLGKTTIAKVIYNEFNEHFKRSCFLENVREMSQDELQTKLLSDILIRKIDGDSKRHYKIKDVVKGQKVLLVLDDVDNMSQIEKLLGDYSWYTAGSWIIITTRNEEVLLALERTYHKKGLHEVYRYKPNLMDNNLALQLFSKHAFEEDSPPEGYDDLAKKVVSFAGGLPLVLVTLGSLLLIENDKYLWQEKLKKLQELPREEVLGRLRISYDALENEQQQIFLDIAHLFSGMDKTNPFYMWDDCKFHPSDGINALVRRSLITVGNDNRLCMHDKLIELGKQIVCEKYLGERRLWRFEDDWDILDKHLGTTKNVQLLCLEGDSSVRPRLAQAEDFRKLPNLRYLSFNKIYLDGDFKNLLQNLRWLQWSCPANCAPTNLHMKNLVVLILDGSHFSDDWGGWSQIKMSNKLKVLNLSSCKNFIRTPHLSSAFPTLERLEVACCTSLCRFDGLEELESLKYMDVLICDHLESLPDLSKLTMLQTLTVNWCKKLVEIQGLDRLASLKHLDIINCESLNSLPDLSNLASLTIFDSSWCNKLVEIQGLDILASLEHLDISCCESLNSLPDLSNLESLITFDSSRCRKVVEIQGLDILASLERLDISGCESLNSLPDLSNLKSLTRFDSSGCKKLVEIQGLDRLASLERLDISGCESLNSLPDLSNLKSLTRFDSSRCEKLVEIQGLDRLASLERLDISGCESLNSLPDLSNLKSLTRFDSSGCEKLVEIQGLDRLASLERLDISGCESLNSLPDLSNLKSLTRFDSSGCEKLVEIQGIDRLASLEHLDIRGCESLNSLPDLSNLESLTTFDSSRCEKLVEIQGLDRLASLEYLDISGCESLNSLPDLSNLESLTIFYSLWCQKLVEIQGLDRLTSLKHLSIRSCESLNSLPDLSNLKSLTRFDSSRCEKLVEIQGLDRLASLEHLDISRCESLNSLPDLSNLKSLTRFDSSRCEKLVEIQGLDRLASLEYLDISGCESLNSLPDLSNLESLTRFDSSWCQKLVEIQGLDRLASLKHLNISGCESLCKKLVEIQGLDKLTSLECLDISGCESLNSLPDLHGLESLVLLDMHGCKSIKNLPDFSNLTNLKVLNVSFCVKLTKLRGLEELKSLMSLCIIGCESLENLPYLPSTTIQKDYEDEEESSDYLSNDGSDMS